MDACCALAKRVCSDASVGDIGAPCSSCPVEREPDLEDSEPESLEGDREIGMAVPEAEGEDVRAGDTRVVDSREDIQLRESVPVDATVGER